MALAGEAIEQGNFGQRVLGVPYKVDQLIIVKDIFEEN